MAKSKRVEATETTTMPLKLWTCTDHDGVERGNKVASIVLAYHEEQAKELLDKTLIQSGLRPFRMYRYRMDEIPLVKPLGEVLNDGDD